jgi:tetratricopeptide (TPR) repeat protein
MMSQGKPETDPPAFPAPAGRRELLVSGALTLLTLLVYAPAFTFPFVNFDDPAYASQNPQVQAGLSGDGVRWAFTTFHSANWHPLTWLSLQLDATLYGGMNAGGYHLTNVLLHVANTLLLFLVLDRLTGAVWRSAVVAALFALHPLHVESVAWVSERKDVLSTLFWMLTLAAYGSYVRRPGVGRYLLVVLALGLGLLAKPMLVTLPCVLLLLDWWPLDRWRPGPEPAPAVRPDSRVPAASWQRLLLEKVPLFVLVLAACVVTFLAQLQSQAVATFDTFPLTARLGNALLAYVGYLGNMLWPLNLAAYYPHPGADVSLAEVLAAGLLLGIVTWLVLGPGRPWPYLRVGWLWYLGTLVPVIGLVQVGGQAMADRYTYIPLIGIFLALTWGAADLALAWRLPRPAVGAAAALVLAACGALTWTQVGYWKSSLDLWEHAVAVTTPNFHAHLCLGQDYLQQGRFADAEREFEKAVAVKPGAPAGHANRGAALAALGRPQEAAAEYRRAVALEPYEGLHHFNLANVLRELGWHDEAMVQYREANVFDPKNALAHNNLGHLLQQLGRLEEALEEYRRAIALDPQGALAYHNLGSVLVGLGRTDEAVAAFHHAIALNPEDAQYRKNLGRLLQEVGRLEEARAAYQKAVELQDPQAGQLLRDCDGLLVLRARLPALIAGRDAPANHAERLAFVDLCRQPGTRRYALAVRLYREAFRADPNLTRGTSHRFNAAAAAAAAGCGQSAEAAELPETEKAELRQQALSWLRSDLDVLTPYAASAQPRARGVVQQVLRTWQRNADLAGVRDPSALAQLPAAERAAWQQLWREAAAVLAQASAPQQKP